ncbi:hypothetical protein [Paenibacillus piri]|uniref:DUF4025 domain-containing protein n=1 Tax=Paenibacillus piri TaxID=2547395 RepID=A0A4R5KGN6_9BACL|nr:hypothetical protein [Paenibacillus piri]TDF93868.1 hypothetical protein E1757_26165 [Paenibacillus piri]
MSQTNRNKQAAPGRAEQAGQAAADACNQGREDYFMDIDRMVNEGLGGGNVTINNGLIEESTTDTMDHPESVAEHNKPSPEKS